MRGRAVTPPLVECRNLLDSFVKTLQASRRGPGPKCRGAASGRRASACAHPDGASGGALLGVLLEAAQGGLGIARPLQLDPDPAVAPTLLGGVEAAVGEADDL